MIPMHWVHKSLSYTHSQQSTYNFWSLLVQIHIYNYQLKLINIIIIIRFATQWVDLLWTEMVFG